MGFSMKSPVPPVDSRYSDGMIWNAEKATFDGKATSGVQSVNFTVSASTASILARLPV